MKKNYKIKIKKNLKYKQHYYYYLIVESVVVVVTGTVCWGVSLLLLSLCVYKAKCTFRNHLIMYSINV